MTDMLFAQRGYLLKLASMSDTDESVYSLPILPKIGIAINVNASILLIIPIILITSIDRHNNIHSIVILSKMMLCFWVGVGVAIASGLCDYGARSMYRIENAKKGFFWKCADLFDYSALGMSLASMAIFFWAAWYAISALREVALNF